MMGLPSALALYAELVREDEAEEEEEHDLDDEDDLIPSGGAAPEEELIPLDDGVDDDSTGPPVELDKLYTITKAKGTKCASQRKYIAANGDKAHLYAMCLGLRGFQQEPLEGEEKAPEPRILGDFSIEPFHSSKNKKIFKPAHGHLADEVKRRYAILGVPLVDQWKKPESRKVHELHKWLASNPLTDDNDVVFLQTEESRFYRVLRKAEVEKATLARHTSEKRSISPTPGSGGAATTQQVFNETSHMRLVHCLIVPEIRAAYKARYRSMDRAELDARNSGIRPKTWEQLMVDQFNDVSFQPMSLEYPYLHAEFAESQALPLDKCCRQKLTTENISSWIQDRKGKLNKLMLRWNKSGSGDGMPAPIRQKSYIEELDREEEIVTYNGARKADFLREMRPSMLYFWKVVEDFDIIDETVTIMPATVGVSSSSPTATGTGSGDGSTPPSGYGSSSGAQKQSTTRKKQKTAEEFFVIQRDQLSIQREQVSIQQKQMESSVRSLDMQEETVRHQGKVASAMDRIALNMGFSELR